MCLCACVHVVCLCAYVRGGDPYLMSAGMYCRYQSTRCHDRQAGIRSSPYYPGCNQ